MGLYEAAERLAELLKAMGVYERVVVASRGAECIILEAARGEALHVIALAARDDWVYAKLAPVEALGYSTPTCDRLYYNPYGLYAFAKSVEALAEKIAAKQARLAAQQRLVQKVLERSGIPE